MRPSVIAYEVLIESGDITGGIVDAMQVNEYFATTTKKSVCLERSRVDREFTNQEKNILRDFKVHFPCERGYTYCRECPIECDVKSCRRHGFSTRYTDNSLLITCFEIKVTKSDFKSAHGHNFKGNCNYYIMPTAIYKNVADLIPDEIGVILYDGKGGLRKKIECKLREISAEEKMWAVHAILKRNRHGCNYDYENNLK